MFVDPKGCGAKGGQSRSEAKRRAVRLNGRKRRKGTAVPIATTTASAPVAPQLEPQSAEWYRAEINSRTEALRVLDIQGAALTNLLRQENGVKSAGPDGESAAKLLRENVLTASVIRKEKKRLENDLRLLEATTERPLDPRQALREKAAKLKGVNQ